MSLDIPIDTLHLDKVCKLGDGAATCAFLAGGAAGLACAKGTSIEFAIRERLAEGTMNAKGDNCPGYRKGS